MSLVVWLPLNGNLDNQGLSDVSITVSGTTSYAAGKIGQALSCNGSSYWIISSITLTQTTSICLWIKTTDTNAMPWVLTATGYANTNFWIYDGYYYLNTGDGANNPFQNNGSNVAALTDGNWHHYVITFDGTSCLLYIDGVYAGKAKTYKSPVTSNNTIKLAGGFSNGHSYDTLGSLNDFRVYDHCLSDKEVKEISKGLILHYKLDDRYVEPTNNLITSSDCLSNTCYNDAINKYNYGANSDMYKTTGEFEGKFCTKVYMGTSGNSAYPYVYVNNAFVSDGTNSPAYKTISFDFFGTIVPGNKIIPYKLGSGSGTCTWVNETLSESGSSASSANISVTPGIWNHIVMTLHGTSEADAQWGYIRIGTTSHTSDTANYWLFANMQIELKDHATPYVGVGGSREENIIYDVSGYGHDGTAVEPLEISNDTPRYKYCLTNINTYPLYSIFSIEEFENITISCWVKLAAWGKQTSGLWATSSSTTSPSDYTTTTCNHRDSGFDIRGTNGTTYRLSCTSSHIPLNTWKHVVFRHNGTTAQLFINGVATTNVSCPTKLVGFNAIFLGYSLAGGAVRQCQGSWSDFRIYATALSAEDILELYHTAASVDNTGNLFAYQLNEV